jgi:hypothetical protein
VRSAAIGTKAQSTSQSLGPCGFPARWNTGLHHCTTRQLGRMLEVMWLARLRRRSAEQPHICRLCGGYFVHPVYWHEAGETSQRVLLRCDQCDTWRYGTFREDELDSFDRVLDEQTARMIEEAERLRRERLQLLTP